MGGGENLLRVPTLLSGIVARDQRERGYTRFCKKDLLNALCFKVAEPENSATTPPLPTTQVKSGMDIGILIDSSSGVSADEFKRLKSFISQLVISINKQFSNVHFGIIVYSDKPDLVMSLQNINRIKVKSIIKGVKYTPGGHRTDLAMMYASQKLFCPKGCEDRPEAENVLIVFTSEKTNAESLPYSLVSPIMKVSESTCLTNNMIQNGFDTL